MMSQGAGKLVWFSNGRPRSRSPSGIQHASPLQRTWMMRCRYGRRLRNFAQVLGAAAVSSFAAKTWEAAVIRIAFNNDLRPGVHYRREHDARTQSVRSRSSLERVHRLALVLLHYPAARQWQSGNFGGFP